jgi:hypothetical protein
VWVEGDGLRQLSHAMIELNSLLMIDIEVDIAVLDCDIALLSWCITHAVVYRE